MCKKYPSHIQNEFKQVSAKSFLIGRSHAASPQRGIKNDQVGQMNYDFFDKFAKALIENLDKNFQKNLVSLKKKKIYNLSTLLLSIDVFKQFHDAEPLRHEK